MVILERLNRVPSEIVTRDTFLPPCSLISPPNGSVVTDLNPVFTWNPVGVSSFPYGSIYSGESNLWIYDQTANNPAWSPYFTNMTTSSATYNQDGQAELLQVGHSYYWESWGYGYNENGKLIAYSWSEYRDFYFGNVADIDAQAITRHNISMAMFQEKIDQLVAEGQIQDSYQLNELPPLSRGVAEYSIDVDWHAYPGATGYKVYRSVNGDSFNLIFQDEPTTSWDWYGFYDYDVSEGNAYTYYVTAYGSGWETDPSPTVTIDTFLPPCSLVSPADESIITDPTPTFTWNPVGLTSGDFPYGSIYSGRSNLDVIEEANWDYVWEPYFNDLTTSSATYNQDGHATTPLETGKGYEWQIDSFGYNENGKLIAYSWSEYRDFYFGNVADIDAQAITRHNISMAMFQEKIDQLVAEGQIQDSYQLNELSSLSRGVAEYSIDVDWHSYPNATGYKVYRSVNGGSYSVVFQDEPTTSWDWYGFYDYDVSEGNSYTYYVTAYGSGWETDPSPTVTIDTFLPPCSLINPADESFITNPTPTFTWNPVGLTSGDFPFGSIYSGRSNLDVIEDQNWDWVWNPYFNDLTTSSATYNQDGQAAPLEAGKGYEWQIDSFGYNENGKLIAYSWSEYRDFYYGNVVAQFEAYAITTSMEMFQAKMDKLVEEELIPDSYHLNEPPPLSKGVTQYLIDVDWHSYPGATGYKVYRSVNGGSYSIIFQDEPTTSYDWYGFYDEDVSEGNSYTYYVTAYGSGWETDPSPEVTIDTFLPPCSLVSPADESIITDPTPTFTWNPVGLTSGDFPYESIYSGNSDLFLYDETADEVAWWPDFDNMTTSTATYNQDGYADPLVAGHSYGWGIESYGYDESWNFIAVSVSEYWYFGYTGP